MFSARKMNDMRPRQQGLFTKPTLLVRFLPLLFLAGCSEKEPIQPKSLHTFEEDHMGTLFRIRTWAEDSEMEAATQAARAAFAEVHRLEMIFSDYQPDSEVISLATLPADAPHPVSKELFEILEIAVQLSSETDGAFDVTVGPMIRLWRMSRKNHRMPTEEQMKAARERSGFQKLQLEPSGDGGAVIFTTENMRLDFGGIVKGVAADAALEIMREAGFPQTVIAASGDIAVGDAPPGAKAWRVGIESLDVIEDPDRSYTGIILLENAAVSTSGDARRFFELDGVRYSHIVDPVTALGLTERIGVTVVAPNATDSDSLATAVSILGATDGLEFTELRKQVECLIIRETESGELERIESSGFGALLAPEQ